MERVFVKATPHSLDITQCRLVPQLIDISICDINIDNLKAITENWIVKEITNFNHDIEMIDGLIESKNLKVFNIKTGNLCGLAKDIKDSSAKD